VTESGKRWLKGCGIGCGMGCLLVVIGLIIIGVAGWGLVKHAFHGMSRAAESYERLLERHGRVEEWVPPADGVPGAVRLETFVSVREELGGAGDALDTTLRKVDLDELRRSETSLRDVPRVLRALSDVVEAAGVYMDERNRALLETGMGLGEYVYLYSLAYWSWLGHAPEDGPILDVRHESGSGGRVEISGFDEENSSFSPEKNRRRYRRYTLALLRNQLEALPPAPPAEPPTERPAEPGVAADGGEAWREVLSRELRLFENGPGRILWQDGLPPGLEEALEPFRSRLEATYRETTNLFELPPHEGDR
jgi:hypothetical protein